MTKHLGAGGGGLRMIMKQLSRGSSLLFLRRYTWQGFPPTPHPLSHDQTSARQGKKKKKSLREVWPVWHPLAVLVLNLLFQASKAWQDAWFGNHHRHRLWVKLCRDRLISLWFWLPSCSEKNRKGCAAGSIGGRDEGEDTLLRKYAEKGDYNIGIMWIQNFHSPQRIE